MYNATFILKVVVLIRNPESWYSVELLNDELQLYGYIVSY